MIATSGPPTNVLTVGQTATVRKTISEADVILFAGVTGDVNPVHLDEVAASQSPFGGRIAHGMLAAGLISAALANKLPGPGTIYLQQSLRFTRPVRFGDTISATVTVLEVLAERNRVRLITTCANQRGETVIEGEALVQVPPELVNAGA